MRRPASPTPRGSRTLLRVLCGAACACALAVAAPSLAEEPRDDAVSTPSSEGGTVRAEDGNELRIPAPGAPSLGLDSLLRPRGTATPRRTSYRGGKDRETWERDFSSARAEVVEIQRQVADIQQQIRDTSQNDWSYSPTGGGGAPVDPEVLRLRAQLKRDKKSLEAAETRLRDLEVEASLADVPDHWIEAPTP